MKKPISLLCALLCCAASFAQSGAKVAKTEDTQRTFSNGTSAELQPATGSQKQAQVNTEPKTAVTANKKKKATPAKKK